MMFLLLAMQRRYRARAEPVGLKRVILLVQPEKRFASCPVSKTRSCHLIAYMSVLMKCSIGLRD
jgi:hypothetical protein